MINLQGEHLFNEVSLSISNVTVLYIKSVITSPMNCKVYEWSDNIGVHMRNTYANTVKTRIPTRMKHNIIRYYNLTVKVTAIVQ